jgi:hypothetical protein
MKYQLQIFQLFLSLFTEFWLGVFTINLQILFISFFPYREPGTCLARAPYLVIFKRERERERERKEGNKLLEENIKLA